MPEFDTSDYEVKKQSLELAKAMVLLEQAAVLSEWSRLIQDKNVQIYEYPALFGFFNKMAVNACDKQKLDAAFNNPLIDIALMYGIKNSENPPGEKSE